MENLEKLIYDLYKKNARQCTNEEIYNASGCIDTTAYKAIKNITTHY